MITHFLILILLLPSSKDLCDDIGFSGWATIISHFKSLSLITPSNSLLSSKFPFVKQGNIVPDIRSKDGYIFGEGGIALLMSMDGVKERIWTECLKVKVKVAQSCLTLCDHKDCIVHGILQARILEWVAFPFSRGSSQPRNWTRVSGTAGGFFTNWAMRAAPLNVWVSPKFTCWNPILPLPMWWY